MLAQIKNKDSTKIPNSARQWFMINTVLFSSLIIIGFGFKEHDLLENYFLASFFIFWRGKWKEI